MGISSFLLLTITVIGASNARMKSGTKQMSAGLKVYVLKVRKQSLDKSYFYRFNSSKSNHGQPNSGEQTSGEPNNSGPNGGEPNRGESNCNESDGY